MIPVGIEAMNVFPGSTYINVLKLAEHRNLDLSRFQNLMVDEKAVALPYEDPITFGINAARPILDSLSDSDRNRIEMVITSTESSFDFGKSMSTYFHHYLGLNRNCRLFELKNACYSGVAGLQNAVNFILSRTSPGAKALVIATDISRFILAEGEDPMGAEWSFAEPTAGSGAVAMLVSDQPYVFQLDVGASGYYGYEVMDTCRPAADTESGDSDLSLLSYLDCCENAFQEYRKRVPEADFEKSFGYLAFHTPFGGMIKGAHRNLMRKNRQSRAQEISSDFDRRVSPGLAYSSRIGNSMGASAMISLASTIDNANFSSPQRIGCFSYGSGCCSEFFSGVSTEESRKCLAGYRIRERLDARYELSMEEYDQLLRGSNAVRFGTRDVVLDKDFPASGRSGAETLVLKKIRNYHREYEWRS